MTFQLDIPSEVKRQLRTIARWYREQSGSVAIAESWYDGFHLALESLRENPQRCGIAHEDLDVSFELRELLYGSGRKKTHRALFRIEGNTVEILSIRHVAQQDVASDDLAP